METISQHYGRAIETTLSEGVTFPIRIGHARMWWLDVTDEVGHISLPPVGPALAGTLPVHNVLPGGIHFIVAVKPASTYGVIIEDYYTRGLFFVLPGKMCFICLANDAEFRGSWVAGCVTIAPIPVSSSSVSSVSVSSSSSSSSPSPSPSPSLSSSVSIPIPSSSVFSCNPHDGISGFSAAGGHGTKGGQQSIGLMTHSIVPGCTPSIGGITGF